MPLQLTTSLNVGALDPNSPYQQVKIVEFQLNPTRGTVDLTVQHGNTVDGSWVLGKAVEGITVRRFRIDGSDYATMMASVSAAAGEVYYDKVSTLLYQWLLDKSHYVGTIV
jgi:hypothetical protein